MENSEQTKGENSTMRARKGWEILLLPSSSQPLSRGSNTGMGSQIDLNKHFSIISQIGKDAARRRRRSSAKRLSGQVAGGANADGGNGGGGGGAAKEERGRKQLALALAHSPART